MKEKLFEYLERYIEFCIEMFKYDIEVFSQPWMYWCLLAPAFCYLIFFTLKWSVITAPLWITINVVTKGPLYVIKGIIQVVKKKS